MPPASLDTLRRLNTLASASLVALICLCLAWEARLAPLHPGGSWLVLKTLPLLLPLVGILRGKRYTYQWSSLLILAYVAEGVVRLMSESGTAATLAAVELALASLFFVAVVLFARLTRPDTAKD